ncbi:hypothetical protein P3S67_007994 [Capsicum chacoense]
MTVWIAALGMLCDLLTGHVIGLDLSCSLLNGIIYANSSLFQLQISCLSNLVSLDLSISYINGLQLDQRTFETVLQNLTNLKVVSLFGVNISSPIPMNLSFSLRNVDLKVTNLQGVLTKRFFLLPNLERLYLSNNYLLTTLCWSKIFHTLESPVRCLIQLAL